MNNSAINSPIPTDHLFIQWVKQGEKAFSLLFESRALTDFDKAIFAEQYHNVKNGSTVSFSSSEDNNFSRIRANRVKMFGYSWHSESSCWIKLEKK